MSKGQCKYLEKGSCKLGEDGFENEGVCVGYENCDSYEEKEDEK
jgi:hypothetical protein